MDKAQLKREILNTFYSMSDDEFIKAYKKGCTYFNCMSDEIFPMSEFNEREGNLRPFSEIYEDIDTDDFSFNCEYYYIDAYRRYHSFNHITDEECFVRILDIFVDEAIDGEYDFGSPKIAEIYEKAKEEEE